MPIPAGYYYKDGGYWNLAGEGPFGFAAGSSTPILLAGFGSSVVHVGTWETKPSSGLVVGDIAIITNVGVGGYSTWRWDGTKWRTLGPVTLSEFYSTAGVVNAAGSGNVVVALSEVALPADLLKQGARLNFSGAANFGNATESRGNNLRISTVQGVPGTLLCSNTTGGAGQVNSEFSRQVFFTSDTETISASTGPGPINNAGAQTVGVVATSSIQYLQLVSNTSASNAIVHYAFRTTLEV